MVACRGTIRRIIGSVIFFLAVPVAAQDAHWKELYAKVHDLQARGRYEEAIPLAKEDLRVAEAVYEKDSPFTALSLEVLASLYKSEQSYTEAESYFKRSLDIYDKVLSGHPLVAHVRNALAEIYRLEGRYREAEPLYLSALNVLEKDPDAGGDIAAVRNNLGLLYEAEARYEEAQRQDDRALELVEQLFGPESAKVADSLNNLGQLRQDQGKYPEAAALFQRALDIYGKLSGADSPEAAATLNNLGALYSAEGKYDDAAQYYKRALAVDEKSLGGKHPDVATDLNNVGSLLLARSNYGEAERLYRRALAIDEGLPNKTNPAVARDLSNLALLYQDEGKFTDAEQCYRKAVDIDTQVLGKQHPMLAILLSNLGDLYQQLGRSRDAEPLFKSALAIDESALGGDHPYVARDLNNLGALYLEISRLSEAEPLFQRAVHIEQTLLGTESPFQAAMLNNLATVYRNQQKYAEAESLYQRALAMNETIYGKDDFTVAKLLHNLAALYYAQGKFAQAGPVWDRSLNRLREQFDTQFPYMSEKDRLSFLATANSEFPLYFSFCFRYQEQAPDLAGKIYDLVLWQKGLVVNGITDARAKILASGDPEALTKFEHMMDLRGQLARLRNAPPSNLGQWRQNVERLQEQCNQLETYLVQRVRSFGKNKKLAQANWHDVQKALGPGEAAVEFVHFNFHDGRQWTAKSYYVALVLTPQTRLAPKMVVLGEEKELESALADYQDLVGTMRPDPASGVRFYRAFWKPLEAGLAGAKRVYVAPDSALNEVSWAAIPTGDGSLISEKYDLDAVLSTKDLLREREPRSPSAAVLIGNPTFDVSESGYRAAFDALKKEGVAKSTTGGLVERPPSQASAAPSISLVARMREQRSRDAQGGQLVPLPGTEVELESIGALLQKNGWRVEAYSRDRALVEAVKQVNNPRLLHVATHGFFEADQVSSNGGGDNPHLGVEDPMLRSGLYFAGANRFLASGQAASGLDDGVLTAYEAAGLNLQGTELVVLSACETGLGKISNGEGVFGLRRALQEAGADGVLMSLWSVPDEQTQRLMTLFYEKWLSGEDKHEALHEAQRDLRNELKSRWKTAPPYFWAGFVLVGR